MAAHSSILAWRIPGTEEPDGLQSIGSQRIRQRLKQLGLHSTHGVLNSAGAPQPELKRLQPRKVFSPVRHRKQLQPV